MKLHEVSLMFHGKFQIVKLVSPSPRETCFFVLFRCGMRIPAWINAHVTEKRGEKAASCGDSDKDPEPEDGA